MHPQAHTLSEQQKAAIITAYRAGDKYKVIAERFGITDSGVWGVVSRSGCELSRNTVTEADLLHMRAFCRTERRIRPLAHPPGESGQRRRLAVNEYVFDAITPESAYWIGLLMADGSVVVGASRQIVLNLSGDDGAMVQEFKEFLRAENTVTVIPAGHNRQGWARAEIKRLAVSSNRLIEALSRYGVVPRKTASARASLVEMHPDFWRGMVDGDGSIRSTGAVGLRLCGAPDIIRQFAEFVRAVVPAGRVHVGQHSQSASLFEATMNGKTALLVLAALYETNGPALPRKRSVAVGWFSSHSKTWGPSRGRARSRPS